MNWTKKKQHNLFYVLTSSILAVSLVLQSSFSLSKSSTFPYGSRFISKSLLAPWKSFWGTTLFNCSMILVYIKTFCSWNSLIVVTSSLKKKHRIFNVYVDNFFWNWTYMNLHGRRCSHKTRNHWIHNFLPLLEAVHHQSPYFSTEYHVWAWNTNKHKIKWQRTLLKQKSYYLLNVDRKNCFNETYLFSQY